MTSPIHYANVVWKGGGWGQRPEWQRIQMHSSVCVRTAPCDGNLKDVNYKCLYKHVNLTQYSRKKRWQQWERKWIGAEQWVSGRAKTFQVVWLLSIYPCCLPWLIWGAEWNCWWGKHCKLAQCAVIRKGTAGKRNYQSSQAEVFHLVPLLFLLRVTCILFLAPSLHFCCCRLHLISEL